MSALRDPSLEPDALRRETMRQAARWHSFQVVFVVLWVGTILDVFTTYLGYAHTGESYEQNPVGAYLVDQLGWAGLLLLLTSLCALCYVSVRHVAGHIPSAWMGVISFVLALLALVRWVAVVTALLFLTTT